VKRCAIIGTGISGLTAAYYLKQRVPDLSLTLIDRNDRAGGVIRTELVDGCIVEAGPDSFLTQKAAARELCAQLGLQDQFIYSNDSKRKTFIFQDGKLKVLPGGMFLMVPVSPTFLSTDLISWAGKMAAMNDLFATPEEGDPTVAEWVEDRFGIEILNAIAEPLIAGIYGSDVRRLSLKCSLPQIWEMQKHGSLIVSMIKTRYRNTSNQPLFTSLLHGMQTLIDAIAANLKDAEWKMSTVVHRIEPDQNAWVVENEVYDAVIIATSAIPLIQTERGIRINSLLGSVRRNSAIVAAAGYKNLEREGFGWVVPAAERRSVLACTYVTNKFPGRTPPGYFLVRIFIGGSQADCWIDRSDSEITAEIYSELKRIAGLNEIPQFTKIYRMRSAMPEYAPGHDQTIAEVKNLIKLERTLFITGNMFSGVGIPDCIVHARNTADEAAEVLAQ
jgi:oxygen-dependent protoporphyrinogen oxidase